METGFRPECAANDGPDAPQGAKTLRYQCVGARTTKVFCERYKDCENQRDRNANGKKPNSFSRLTVAERTKSAENRSVSQPQD
jgi:hypothetical protein